MKLKNKNQTNFHLIISILIIITSIYSLGYNFIIGATALEKLDRLGYFTIQSNILVLVVVFLNQMNIKVNRKVQLVVCINILVTALIYQLFLNPGTYPHLFKLFERHINHGSTAILYFLWFLYKDDESKLSIKNVWIVVPFPIAYSIYAVIEGYITGKFRYFFINLPKLGVAMFAFWIFAITILFLVLGFFTILLSKKISKN